MSELLWSGPGEAPLRLLLAHGAGAPMTSPWLERFASELARRAVATARFEFAYMARRRRDGVRRPAPRAETLAGELEAAIASMPPGPVPFIGGKSMGGRVASLIADRLWQRHAIRGLVCLGYPFHPPGQPQCLRTAHLQGLVCPTLIIQGSRDPFGTSDEVNGYRLPGTITLTSIADGDHDLAVRRSTARRDGLVEAADAVAAFLAAHSAG